MEKGYGQAIYPRVTLRYQNRELCRKVRVDDDGGEWCFPLGQYSMAPVLRPNHE